MGNAIHSVDRTMTSIAQLKNLPPSKRGELTSTLRPTIQMGDKVGSNHPWVDCGGLTGWTDKSGRFNNVASAFPVPPVLFCPFRLLSTSTPQSTIHPLLSPIPP